MPLDNSLNNDIKRAHEYHCALSYDLPMDHVSKFSTKTPKWISKGIRRLVDLVDVEDKTMEAGVPSSERIIEDCHRALKAMEIVYQNGGKIVAGLANRNGQRYSKEGTACRGGKRPAKAVPVCDRWLHPLGRVAQSLKLEKILKGSS